MGNRVLAGRGRRDLSVTDRRRRAVRALAAAAEAAHRTGGALSIDSPARIRVSTNGDAVLAFRAPSPVTIALLTSGASVRCSTPCCWTAGR